MWHNFKKYCLVCDVTLGENGQNSTCCNQNTILYNKTIVDFRSGVHEVLLVHKLSDIDFQFTVIRNQFTFQ